MSTFVVTSTSTTVDAGSYQQAGTTGAFTPISGSTGGVPGAVIAVPTTTNVTPASATAWLASPASRSYQGRWVALNASGAVVADADSPGDLPAAILQSPDVAVFYVIPDGVTLAG